MFQTYFAVLVPHLHIFESLLEALLFAFVDEQEYLIQFGFDSLTNHDRLKYLLLYTI